MTKQKTTVQIETEKTNLQHELAYMYLHKSGYKILLRNYESVVGEMDMIAKQNGDLVFVGVNREPLDTVAAYYIKRYGLNVRNINVRFVRVNVDHELYGTGETKYTKYEISETVEHIIPKIV